MMAAEGDGPMEKTRTGDEDPRYGEPILLKGNEAVCEGAIWAGCRYFFGYPITPQNQIPEMMSRRMPEVGGVFLQAESEVSAINMVYGAACAGVRVMTSSSSPGISLMQEGISYIAGCELPCVIVNITRGGPGLGNIGPAQSDYFQACKGGGHGDYKVVTYGPASVQEIYDLTAEAFETADRVRGAVMVLGDAVLGQMMEPVRMRVDEHSPPPPKPWATTGAAGRPPNVINSLLTLYDDMERLSLTIQNRFERVAEDICRAAEYRTEDADVLLVAYGTSARVCLSACDRLRSQGVRAGLIRPITLQPYPYKLIRERAENARFLLTVEMNLGQMVEDVRLGVEGRCPVHFLGRTGGNIPGVPEVVECVEEHLAKAAPTHVLV